MTLALPDEDVPALVRQPLDAEVARHVAVPVLHAGMKSVTALLKGVLGPDLTRARTAVTAARSS